LLSLEYNIVAWDKKGSEGTLACLPLLNLDRRICCNNSCCICSGKCKQS